MTDWKSRCNAFVGAYIEELQEAGFDDSQIIDRLTDVFFRDELEELGYGDFIRAYFEEDDND